MNVYKNLSFGLRLRKFPKHEIETRVMEAARILGIEDLLERKPKELSGGQRQRVAMGRAIIRKPQAFLFDEPLSNLDAKLRVQMRAELSKFHEQLKTTIVYVTHDQIEAMTLADRIVVMDQGVVLQVGSPLEVYDNPKNLFVAGFIGSPAMNFIDVSVTKENGTLFLKGANLKLAIPKHLRERYLGLVNQDLVFGIRPEHIYTLQQKDAFPGGEVLRVKVDVVEPVGSVVILLASFASGQLTASVDPQTKAGLHDELDFLIDMNRMHLFNKDTEEVC
jgi:multiple sugar transport system ATP-binding protein